LLKKILPLINSLGSKHVNSENYRKDKTEEIFMVEIINRALMPVINDCGMSAARVEALVYIKEFIDRISSKSYMRMEDLEKLKERYGVYPDVVTWGDYFQTELGTTFRNMSDDLFFRAIDTVKFDMISSYLIFTGKDASFLNWIEDSYNDIVSHGSDNFTDEEKEIIHLKILKDYFIDLGIKNSFTESELKWHSSFSEAMAI